MIVAFTLPAMGHVKPMMPLLSGLVASGQNVVCFGHKNFEQIIRSTGAGFSAYPDIEYNIDAPDFNLIKMAADLIHASETIYAKLMPEIAEMAPRLILQDFMALWAGRIGTELDILRIHTIPTLVFNAATQKQMRREDGVAKLVSDIFHGAPALVRAKIKSRFAVSIGEAFGLEGSWRNLAPPLCELVFCIEALQFGDPHGEVPRHYIGPTHTEHKAPVSSTSKGYALITFGTLSNNETARFEAAIRGAFFAGYSVVAQCGGKVDHEYLKRVTKSLETEHPGQTATILAFVPDLEILIVGADIVIHHAGMATTWETVRHCKRALFIPTIADQKVLASQLERNGFGIRLPHGSECDPQAIALALKDIQTRDYPWAKIQELLARAGGAPMGVKVILDALETKK